MTSPMKSFVAALAVGLLMSPLAPVRAEGPAMAHMVFFTLAEKSDANRAALVAGCRKYLNGHEGVQHFSVGTNDKSFDRDVNDRSFDVSLHLVFKDRAAHDVYHDHPRHLEFIEKNKHLWGKVVVFDSFLAEGGSTAAPATPLAK